MKFVICLAFLMAGHNVKAQKKSPNVVMIFLDDSGYGDYEHNGNPTIKTPNLSTLKDSGINFTQFYVPTAACTASRYSLLTGRYPGRSGLGSWVINPKTKQYIHPKEITIAEGLKSIGYKTAMFGKWHLGTPNKANNFTPDALPLAHGFDSWIGTNVSHDYENSMLIKSQKNGNKPAVGYEVISDSVRHHQKVAESLTGICTKEAIRFIEKNHKSPFFAYVAYNMPHLGLWVSDKFKGHSRRGTLGDVMEELDFSIGEILKTLERKHIRENTIVIISSDNGPWIKFETETKSKYGDTRLQVGYATPFRDGKGSTWEGGHRVLGMISWPAKIKKHHNEQVPVSTLDILPTIFSITGVPLPKDRTIDGRDITPLLFGKKFVKPFNFLYNYTRNNPSAIRQGPWKLHIRIGSQTKNNYGFTASKDKPLLFQVEQDLGERINVADKNPLIVDKLLNELENKESQIKEEGTFWDN
ncbi:sulfatase [Halosquirtibacter xylanolyticus]|uniref:sulfatase family protein n=1 Tax=Halosquirtibacter xylanolyticus TaxID=3374599 RepID=UPI00374A7436|nr:sulfatase [Prolixibacteraceae bacterium]